MLRLAEIGVADAQDLGELAHTEIERRAAHRVADGARGGFHERRHVVDHVNRLLEQVCAREDRDLGAVARVQRRPAAPRLGAVHDVVVEERRGVDELHHDRDGEEVFWSGYAEGAGEVDEEWAQPLAVAGESRHQHFANFRWRRSKTCHQGAVELDQKRLRVHVECYGECGCTRGGCAACCRCLDAHRRSFAASSGGCSRSPPHEKRGFRGAPPLRRLASLAARRWRVPFVTAAGWLISMQSFSHRRRGCSGHDPRPAQSTAAIDSVLTAPFTT